MDPLSSFSNCQHFVNHVAFFSFCFLEPWGGAWIVKANPGYYGVFINIALVLIYKSNIHVTQHFKLRYTFFFFFL